LRISGIFCPILPWWEMNIDNILFTLSYGKRKQFDLWLSGKWKEKYFRQYLRIILRQFSASLPERMIRKRLAENNTLT